MEAFGQEAPMAHQVDGVQVGDVVRVYPYLEKGSLVQTKAKVIYIHPEKRFYTVQLEDGIRQSFKYGFAV